MTVPCSFCSPAEDPTISPCCYPVTHPYGHESQSSLGLVSKYTEGPDGSPTLQQPLCSQSFLIMEEADNELVSLLSMNLKDR